LEQNIIHDYSLLCNCFFFVQYYVESIQHWYLGQDSGRNYFS